VDALSPNEIRERYLRASEKIESALRTSGRAPGSVRLMVVTKTHPVEMVRAMIDAGARDLGENYVEEALPKIEAIGRVDGLRWHMIGHVQARKADRVAGHFNLLHSLDSFRLASRLDHFAGQVRRRLPVLLEINVSGETSKFGYPAWSENQWAALQTEVGRLGSLPNLEIRGLMSMSPFSNEPEASRPFFRRMRSLQVHLAEAFPQMVWKELSMGTSTDFVVAVEEGATVVRVGTAILGPRPARA
jgi:pyridoxal phosphate enzyme (YggS family)